MFLDVSEIGTMCDEINVRVEIFRGRAGTAACGEQIVIEELLKNPSTEAASEPSAVWTLRSVHGDRIKDQVRGDFRMSLCNPELKPKICERFVVGLIG